MNQNDVSAVAAPVRESERFQVLDVLRGVAIFGIFMVNIAFFSMPMAEMFDLPQLADGPTSEWVSYGIVRVFFEFKFVSLFSFLFGAGLILQMQSAERRNAPFVGMYLRRTLLLLVIGSIHAWLIWYGDILFVYSFVAFLLLFIRKAPPRIMLTISGILLTFGLLLTTAFIALQAMNPPPKPATAEPAMVAADSASVEEPSAVETESSGAESTDVSVSADDEGQGEEGEATFYRQAIDSLAATFSGDPEPMRRLEMQAYGEGGFTNAFIIRVLTWAMMMLFAVLVSGFGVRIVGMFLLGAAFMKLGFHKKERRRWHVIMLLLGVLGLAGELFSFFLYRSVGFLPSFEHVIVEFLHFGCSIFLCLGYIGAVCLIVHSGLFKPIQYAIACVGRMALTNYLMQSLIATGIMNWWGFARFGTVDRSSQLLLVVSIYVGQMIVSVIWMHFFRIGPLEWVWRSATYLKLQPLLRSA